MRRWLASIKRWITFKISYNATVIDAGSKLKFFSKQLKEMKLWQKKEF